MQTFDTCRTAAAKSARFSQIANTAHYTDTRDALRELANHWRDIAMSQTNNDVSLVREIDRTANCYANDPHVMVDLFALDEMMLTIQQNLANIIA